MKKAQAPQLYKLRPRSVLAFQWLPETDGFAYPKWFADMIETGRAYVVLNDKDRYISLSNKRGDYKGLVGDWVVKDQWNHIHVVSASTFHERYESEGKTSPPTIMKGNEDGHHETDEASAD